MDHPTEFSNAVNAYVASFASAKDALLAGALVCCAEADEKPRLLVFLLLLQVVVCLPFGRFAPHVCS